MCRPAGSMLVVTTALLLAVLISYLLPATEAYTRPDQGEMLFQMAMRAFT